jgi:hypothetical protein
MLGVPRREDFSASRTRPEVIKLNDAICPACQSERALVSDGGRAVCLTCTARWSRTRKFRPSGQPVRVNPWHPSVISRALTVPAGALPGTPLAAPADRVG